MSKQDNRLSPRSVRVLEARDRIIRAVSHLDTIEAIQALQYATASVGAALCRGCGRRHPEFVSMFAGMVQRTFDDEADGAVGLIVPIRAT